jgi:hypothetical protein
MLELKIKIETLIREKRKGTIPLEEEKRWLEGEDVSDGVEELQ